MQPCTEDWPYHSKILLMETRLTCVAEQGNLRIRVGSVVNPDIQLGGHIMWRIQKFGWGGTISYASQYLALISLSCRGRGAKVYSQIGWRAMAGVDPSD